MPSFKQVPKNTLLHTGVIFICLMVYAINESLLGILTVVLSIFFIIKTRNFLIFALSAYNIMTGLAFDYYLRVRPHAFDFYYGNGSSVEYLCILSIICYVVIVYMSDGKTKGFSKSMTIQARLPEFSSLLYYPFLISIIGCSLFILKNESTILTNSFDLRELVKYPFLEYFGIIVLFAIGSAKKSKTKELAVYGAALFLVLVCLATSYRMVAIVIGLSIFFAKYQNSPINKSLMIFLGVFFYSMLMVISYVRLGANSLEPSRLLGYVDGRLDNTFSGVIETALMYTSVSHNQPLSQNIMHFIGTILPLPSSLLPDSMSYVLNIFKVHPGKIPGGGLLAGFFIYFNYMLVIPVFAFLFFSLKYRNKNALFGSMYFICFICVSRWWLYGPFVFFKFSGIFFLVYLLNLAVLLFEKKLTKRNQGNFKTHQVTRASHN